jgi:uncharacterized membrane protein YkoI
MRMFAVLAILACGVAAAQEKPLQIKDLPEAVQRTVREQSKGAFIRTITEETEDGIQQYEVRTVVKGRQRDFNVDTEGKLLAVEEQTRIDSIPAAAKAAILKEVGTGKLGTVEIVTKGNSTVYEASYTAADSSRRSITVKPDGTRP